VGRLEGAILTFLVNAVWQAPVVAAVGFAGASMLARARAAYRHRLWVCALALALLAPLASALKDPPTGAISRDTGSTAMTLVDGAALSQAAAKRLGFDEEAGGFVNLARLASLGYGLFLLGQAIRLASGWHRSNALVARAGELPGSLASVVDECSAAFGRTVRVLVSGELRVPSTFGLIAPVVLLPRELAERPPARPELRAILAHELGHVVRRDCAVNLLCELAALPVSFHPAVRLLKRRIGGAREAACDEAAAASVGPRVYAKALLEVAARACRSERLVGAMGALDGHSLEDRMKTILETRTLMSGRAALSLLVAGMAALGLAAHATSHTAVAIAAVAGPDEMIGHWTGRVKDGASAGKPAAALAIKLTPQGPDIALTLYRYGPDSTKAGEAESLPVVGHRVETGVLRFRTRAVNFRLRPEDAPSTAEAEWQFVVVGKDAGELSVLSNSRVEADKAEGKPVPPPPPPLAMTRDSAATPPLP
jgi:beta-lactamase regulating signal transducer with metallopeptidase domain